MKYIPFLIISIFLMSFKNPDETETSKLYAESLCLRVANLNIDTIYIIKCSDIEMPSKFGRYYIVDISDTIESFLKGRSKEYVIKLFPIEVKKGNIEIGLIDYILEEEKGEPMFNWSGSKVFTYRYIPKAKKYKLINIKAYSI